MRLNLEVREITVSLLHELREPVHTLLGSSKILINKIPQEMMESINDLYAASENLNIKIESALSNLNQEFDVVSSRSAVLWFHEFSATCKKDVKIISSSLKQIQRIKENGITLKNLSLNNILGALPKSLDRLERYVEYFSTIGDEDFSVWDTEKLLRVRYGEDVSDELDK